MKVSKRWTGGREKWEKERCLVSPASRSKMPLRPREQPVKIVDSVSISSASSLSRPLTSCEANFVKRAIKRNILIDCVQFHQNRFGLQLSGRLTHPFSTLCSFPSCFASSQNIYSISPSCSLPPLSCLSWRPPPAASLTEQTCLCLSPL